MSTIFDERALRSRASSLAAFTLAELVVVMTLAGILAGIAIPTFGRIGDIRAGNALLTLQGTIRYAQWISMTSHQQTWLVFSAPGDTCTVYIEDVNNPGKANRIALTNPLDRTNFVVDLNDYPGADLTAVNINGGAELEFDSLGRPYDSTSTALAADGSLTFSNGSSITITAETGYATVVP